MPVALRTAPRPTSWALAAALFAATFVTTTTLGGGFYLATRTDAIAPVWSLWLPWAIGRVWSDPELLHWGLSFSLPTLFILLCHELGHFVACRRYDLPATPPYFLPTPIGLGTFGAFIRIRAPIDRKRVLFDVGVAGPVAGFAALLPFLVYGLARSQPVALATVAASVPSEGFEIYVPGRSLLVELLLRAFHGDTSQAIVNLHPFALAAWVGLFATMLNLLPLGQLDGGHLLYAALGGWHRRLTWPIWGLLVAAGFWWSGWWLWAGALLVLGLRHPRVYDEAAPLGAARRLWAIVALLIFVGSFLPVPIASVPFAAPAALPSD